MPSGLPERLWQKVGADYCTLNNCKYLLVVDYYSIFVEIAKLMPTRSEDVIVQLKSIFFRHGIPELFFSDNCPQFSSQQSVNSESDTLHTNSGKRLKESPVHWHYWRKHDTWHSVKLKVCCNAA